MLHANFTALSSIGPALLRIGVLHCGNMEFFLCSCDLDLDPMTFIYERDPHPLKISAANQNELSKVSVLHTDRTYRQMPPKTLPVTN